MQIKVERIDSANVVAEAKVSKALLEKKEKNIAIKIAKTMKVDGFRKGKVPSHVVMSRHKEQISQDAKQDILKIFLDDALKELNIQNSAVIGEPSITKMEETDNGLDIKIKISFRPKIDLGEYKSFIPEYVAPRVLKKDIDERVNTILKSSAPLKELIEKRAVKNGDFVNINFKGFVDGVAFDGGGAENYLLEIGSNSFIPGFEDGIMGMKIDEEKEIEITFPKEYNSKDLAGKSSLFKVKLNGIKIKDIEEKPNEETLKQFMPDEETPTVEKLEEKVKTQLKNEKLTKIFIEKLRPKFIEALIENTQFALPENIVEQEIDIQIRTIFQKLSKSEIEEYSKNPEKITKIREEYRDEAIKSVKLTFIVDELAKIEKIKVEDQEVMQMIYYEAVQKGQEPKENYEQYKKQGVLPAIKMSIIEDKLFTKLFSKDK
ncbi:MAG: trigger factor [Sulfurospirillum sp.]|nr:trigger factor [Sulfurospirillum sp.]